MILKERKYKKCECCGTSKLVSDESYGCDGCKKPIDDLLQNNNKNFADYLEVTVFNNNTSDATHLHFCSWECVFNKLNTIKADRFITLPYLTYEKTVKGQTVKDFWKAIKEFKK